MMRKTVVELTESRAGHRARAVLKAVLMLLALLWLLLGAMGLATAGPAATPARAELPPAPALAGPLWATPPGAVVPDADRAWALYRQGGFVPVDGNLTRGFVPEVVWLVAHVAADARRAQDLVLAVAPAYLDHVTAYQLQADGSLRMLGVSGDQVPQMQRPLVALDAAFPLSLAAGQAATVLLRVQTTSTQAAMVSLHASQTYAADLVAVGLVLGAIFTVSLLMCLLALGLWLVYRQRGLLLWAAYVAVTSGLWFLFDGLAGLLLPADKLPWANAAIGLLNLASLVLGTFFVRAMFEVRTLSRPLHTLLGAGALALPLVAIASVLAGARNPSPAVLIASLPLCGLLALAIVWQMVRRERVGLLYGPAFLLYLGTSVHNLATVLGWLPMDRLSFYGWQVAGLFNLLSLQVAVLAELRSRMDRLTQERERLLQELAERNGELEQRVSERTQTLKDALRELQGIESEQRELMSMASHEFRTPAAIIKASLDSLALLEDKIPPPVRTRLANIHAASHRMIRLADDVIAHDRLSKPERSVHRVPMDLREVLQALTRQYPESARVHWQLAASAVPVLAEPSLLSIALTNLIDNALRYHPADAPGPVLVRLNLEPPEAPTHACIEVSDQGLGVPADLKALVFERFYVVPRAADEEPPRQLLSGGSAGKSHGLGLAIVHRIARAHGGTVSVHDNQPRGAVFRLCLPLAEAPPDLAA